MAVTKYAKEDIIPIVIHVLSFTTVKFAEYGYKAVLNREMPGLLTLGEDDIDPSMYFQLLLSSDDKLSLAINECIDAIDKAIDTYRIIYSIDLEELYSDERLHDTASQIYSDLYYYADGLIESDIPAAVMELPFTAANAFFFLCKLILNQEIDAELSMEEGFYGTGWEEFEFMEANSNDARVMYELVKDILKMNLIISDIVEELGGNNQSGF